jgi:hypothetical protein
VNSNLEIYRAEEDQIPIEDKARLEGYLEGRAQAATLEREQNEFREKFEKFERRKNLFR